MLAGVVRVIRNEYRYNRAVNVLALEARAVNINLRVGEARRMAEKALTNIDGLYLGSGGRLMEPNRKIVLSHLIRGRGFSIATWRPVGLGRV